MSKLNKYKPVEEALRKAKKKHPNWPSNIFYHLAVLTEEAGEVAKAILQYEEEGGSLEDVKEELYQTAAMCMRILENLPKK